MSNIPPRSILSGNDQVDGLLADFPVHDTLIRRIPCHSQPVTPVDRAKSLWIGQLYVRRLKRYALVREIVNRCWLLLFPIYRQVSRRLVRISRSPVSMPLVAQSDFVYIQDLQKAVLAAEHEVVTPTPRVYPQVDQYYLKSPHDQYIFPETSVAEIPDALVQGGTNIVVANSFAIHHDLFTRAEDFTSEELHDRMELDIRAGQVLWRVLDPLPEFLEVAANFVDACAPNYAHWLTEVAPRVALFCAKREFDGVPLIVNDGLHPNIMESLFTLAARRHPIVALPLGRSVKVARLYLVSCAGYVPFEPRGRYVIGMSHGKFSRLAFEAVRSACFNNLQPRSTPSRIFLRRNSGVRCLINSQEIEVLLISLGFTVVDPEKLSFAMQVQLFREAEVIIGPTGAALANIIFARCSAHIAILISRQEHFIYWYWQNIARASGKSVHYVMGEKIGGDPDNVHADFLVRPEAVVEFVNNLSCGFK